MGARDDQFTAIYRWVTCTTAVSVAALLIVGHWAVPLIFSHSFGPVLPLLIFLGPGALALTIGRLLSYHLLGVGDDRSPFLANAASLVAMAALDVLIIPYFGLWAAALVNALTNGLLVVIQLPILRRHLPRRLGKFFLLHKADVQGLARMLRERIASGRGHAPLAPVSTSEVCE